MNTDLMFSSKTDLWSTPQDLFDALDNEFHFTLDACALPENAKCKRYFTPEIDGLEQEWTGTVWCNPRFSDHGRTIMVEFMCARCKTTASRPLRGCLPSDAPVRNLSDLKAPQGWRDGGFYYPTFCPKCAKKYDEFMSGGMKL